MDKLHNERRGSRAVPSPSSHQIHVDQLVRQAVLIQASVGTLGAVEYLKANRIYGEVIGRVLAGGAIRREDQASRDNPVAWE